MQPSESDASLIDRFVNGREELAFTVLVDRHRPVVEAVCRRFLRNEHDVEEVSQATFLVFSRKVQSIAWRDSVGGWLCAVAQRLARNARVEGWRHHQREHPLTDLTGTAGNGDGYRLPERLHPIVRASRELEHRELERALDDELPRLPAKCRSAVIVCDLEGKTHAQAATELGCPIGSISRRLGRGRAILRHRLERRGITLTILALMLFAGWIAAKSHRQIAWSPAVPEGAALCPISTTGHNRRAVDDLFDELCRTGSSSARDALSRFAADAERAAALQVVGGRSSNGSSSTNPLGEVASSTRELLNAARSGDRSAIAAALTQVRLTCQNCHTRESRPERDSVELDWGQFGPSRRRDKPFVDGLPFHSTSLLRSRGRPTATGIEANDDLASPSVVLTWYDRAMGERSSTDNRPAPRATMSFRPGCSFLTGPLAGPVSLSPGTNPSAVVVRAIRDEQFPLGERSITSSRITNYVAAWRRQGVVDDAPGRT